ncbi:MAG: KamA family radical SAM protein [Sandaracinaceae bacterium]|nr:KamA family radical SAM protein [Sandaracinaceae bacterium]
MRAAPTGRLSPLVGAGSPGALLLLPASPPYSGAVPRPLPLLADLTLASADSPDADWRVQARDAVTTLHGLEAALELTDDERAGAARALVGGFPLSVTPYYLSLADPHDPACPIRRQCVPSADEAVEVPGDLRDPLGEEEHEVAPHLIQRYPDRVLLLATDRCAVYCRFCTRSRMVGDGGGARSMDALAEAFAYIEAHPEVQEVIVSGGDPLVMSTARIARLFERLAQIEHLTNVRLATRAPVTIPQRITDELVQALRKAHPSLWVMTHFNHPKELTPESTAALARLVDAGLPVMNQTVLLRGINDHADTLEALFRGLVKRRVRPYYLLQMDPVRGTGHLRTPLDAGIAIMGALQGRLSGIALPKLIVDTPNGRGKVPVGPDTVVARGEGRTTLRTFRGELVDYLDPPG